jgi:hypothetical protein
MTDQSAFSEEEWNDVLEGPTSAGVMVAMSERGGSFRESFSMAKAYTEARKEHGASELLDTIATSKPKMDRKLPKEPSELAEAALQHVNEGVAAVEAKATPEELEEYKRFVLTLATRVAEAHKGVGDKESASLDRLAGTLGIERSA